VTEELLRSRDVGRVALVASANARAVAEHEGVVLAFDDPRVEVYDNADMFASPASGSAGWDAMAIVPCSMGTAARGAAGISDSLLTRAADVMLKERRRLVIVPREAPMSTIHLRNLLTLSESGVVVVPAAPSFYSRPETVEQLCRTVVERVVAHMGIDLPHYEWTGGADAGGPTNCHPETK
jgi:4-hydroxy-3-polyprenylbenzoate decarboxylase